MCFSKHPPSNHERVEKKRERPPTEEHNERTQMIDEEAEAVRDQLCLMATHSFSLEIGMVSPLLLHDAGRIRRLNLTVPFTFRRLEEGLEGGASKGL